MSYLLQTTTIKLLIPIGSNQSRWLIIDRFTIRVRWVEVLRVRAEVQAQQLKSREISKSRAPIWVSQCSDRGWTKVEDQLRRALRTNHLIVMSLRSNSHKSSDGKPVASWRLDQLKVASSLTTLMSRNLSHRKTKMRGSSLRLLTI